MARRKDGVSMEQAQASLSVLYHQIREADAQQLGEKINAHEKDRFLARQIVLQPGGQGSQILQRGMRTSLLLLFGRQIELPPHDYCSTIRIRRPVR